MKTTKQEPLFEMWEFIPSPMLECGKHTQRELETHIQNCWANKCPLCSEPISGSYDYEINHREWQSKFCTTMMLLRNHMTYYVRKLAEGEAPINCDIKAHQHKSNYSKKGFPMECWVAQYRQDEARLLATGTIQPNELPQLPKEYQC